MGVQVDNSLTIQGPDEDLFRWLYAHGIRPDGVDPFTSADAFSFEICVPAPEDIRRTYPPDENHGRGWIEPTPSECARLRAKYGVDELSDWAEMHWGVFSKAWDAVWSFHDDATTALFGGEPLEPGQGRGTLEFKTGNGGPTEWVVTMSRRWPKLSFDLGYTVECPGHSYGISVTNGLQLLADASS